VAAKTLNVSPFLDFAVDYEFLLTPPDAGLIVHMNVTRPAEGVPDRSHPADRADRVFDATLDLARRPWTARTIRSVLLRFPWMTVTVIAAIYWQALRLRLRGVPDIPFAEEGL
jgi:DUF1365 family protein